jgi:hypothetical protein
MTMEKATVNPADTNKHEFRHEVVLGYIRDNL